MDKKIVLMFPGQGSQYYHMGKELFQNNSRFKAWIEYCDEIVSPLISKSIIEIIYNDDIKRHENFDRLLYSNPALLCIEYCLAKLLLEMNIKPDYVLGYSLGEITASIISDVISLEEGIQYAVDVAKIFEENAKEGRMLAVVESSEIINNEPEMFESCSIAGKNFDYNFVVSGLKKPILSLKKRLDNKNIISQLLPVNYGFHTALMDPFENLLLQLADGINVFPIKIPIISSLKGEEIKKVTKEYFFDILRCPIEFENTIKKMVNNDDYIFIDVGPSGTLSNFVKYMLPDSSESLYLEMMNPFGKDLKTIENLRRSLSL